MCRISYGKLTQINKQSHNSTFSTLPQEDHALSGHAQKYHDCSLWAQRPNQAHRGTIDKKEQAQLVLALVNIKIN